MSETISPERAKKLRDEENALFVDVRETDEFIARRIPGAELQPLSVLPLLPPDCTPERPVIYFCNSGNRTGKAEEILRQRGHSRTYIIDGGITAWEKAGLPIEIHKGALPLSRQVHIAAGSLIVIFLLIGQQVPFFRLFAVFIGLGLFASGLTGTCGMAMLLKKMPWNKKGAQNPAPKG